MQILLTNDDGVFAPGLRALRKELMKLGDVTVVGPALEQSGVGHSITLLEPLVVKPVDDEDGTTLGYMVEGSPADSVKLAICELMPRPARPDRLGDQRREQRRDQRPLLGHRRRRDRGGLLQDHQHRRLARAGRALRLPPRRPERRPGDRADPGQQAADRLALQRQPPGALAGRAQGGPRRPDGRRPPRRGVRATAGPPRAGPTTG